MKAVKGLGIANAHRSHGIPVVGLRQRCDLYPLILILELPVLDSHFQRNFDSRRAAVGIKNPPQAFGRNRDQFFSELNSRNMAQPEKCRMGHALELSPNRVIERLFSMAVNVAPKRRHPVQILLPVYVDQKIAGRAADNTRLLAKPILHLGERMPEIAMIELF